ADYRSNALHHVFHNLHYVRHVDYRDRGKLAVHHALQRRHVRRADARAPVVHRREILQLSLVEEELEAPRHADGFGALNAGHARAQIAIPDIPIHHRARLEVEYLGRLFAHADLRIAVSPPPPHAAQDDGIGRHGVHRRYGSRAQEAPVEIAQGQFFDWLSI